MARLQRSSSPFKAATLAAAAAVTLLLVVLCTAPNAAMAAEEDPTNNDYAVLKVFRDSITTLQTTWKIASGTTEPKSDVYCAWTGVVCNGATVTALKFSSDMKLSGTLPVFTRELGYSSNLAAISISGNTGISGVLPPSWRYLITMENITVVNNKNIYGVIPEEWDDLMGMETLIIRNTSVCGDLPWAWDSELKPSLTNVDLSNNYLGGELPPSWGEMVGIKSFNINNNKKTDANPGNDGSETSGTYTLQSAGFCGCIPESWKSEAALLAGVTAANPDLVSSSCSSTNKCALNTQTCVGLNSRTVRGADGPNGAVRVGLSAVTVIASMVFAIVVVLA